MFRNLNKEIQIEARVLKDRTEEECRVEMEVDTGSGTWSSKEVKFPKWNLPSKVCYCIGGRKYAKRVSVL